jgi:hypothetical protein
MSDHSIVTFRADLSDLARSIQRLMPTTGASGHGVELVHIPATRQLAPVRRRLNRAVVPDTSIFQRFVSCRAVLLPEERPKENAIDFATALVWVGGRHLPQPHDGGAESLGFVRCSIRTAPGVRRRRINTRSKVANSHGYPLGHELRRVASRVLASKQERIFDLTKLISLCD